MIVVEKKSRMLSVIRILDSFFNNDAFTSKKQRMPIITTPLTDKI